MHGNARYIGRRASLPDNRGRWCVGINRVSSWTTVTAWWVSHAERWKFCLAFSNLQWISPPFSNMSAWHSDAPCCCKNLITTVGLCCRLHNIVWRSVVFFLIVSRSWTPEFHILNVRLLGHLTVFFSNIGAQFN